MSRTGERDEWLRLMSELATLDRDAYRRLRAELWEMVAQAHREKSPEQISAWVARAN